MFLSDDRWGEYGGVGSDAWDGGEEDDLASGVRVGWVDEPKPVPGVRTDPEFLSDAPQPAASTFRFLAAAGALLLAAHLAANWIGSREQSE